MLKQICITVERLTQFMPFVIKISLKKNQVKVNSQAATRKEKLNLLCQRILLKICCLMIEYVNCVGKIESFLLFFHLSKMNKTDLYRKFNFMLLSTSL